jgi:uncharacterized membrane-anchored protein YjiN (DUF445 family)
MIAKKRKGPDRLLARHERRAAIEHECVDCHQTIMPGETYVITAVIQDGVFRWDKSHTGWGWCIDQENR